MLTDDPTRNLVPTFSRPPTPPPDPETPPTPSPGAAPPSPQPGSQTARRLLADGDVGPSELAPRRPDPDIADTRTGTSSTGKPPTTAEATALIIGILGVVATGAALLVRWRAQRKLREPTAGQRRDIATPLARILMRRADLSMLGPDIGDLLQAGAATGAYLGDGPLLGPLHTEPGIPDNLQETNA